MSRLTDSDPIPKRLPPVYGYLNHDLLSLKEAVQPISSLFPDLDSQVRIAKVGHHFPSEHGLTREESAAIYLYTMEWNDTSFFKIINEALRSENRGALKQWFGYLKLFYTAIQKLPSYRGNLWRGTSIDVAGKFNKNEEFVWWSITSCSTSLSVVKDFFKENATLFLIEASTAKDITKYTCFPNENEMIFEPGTRFQVVSDPINQLNFHVIHLKEITDDDDFTHRPVTVLSPELTEPTISTKIHIDADGNHYDLLIPQLHTYNDLCCYRLKYQQKAAI